MKARLQQLKDRWQTWSTRERSLMVSCGVALVGAVIYYGAFQPLAAMNTKSVQTLKRQQETLTWMRTEIENKLIPVKVVTTDNVRQLVEMSAGEVKTPLESVQQKDKLLTFSIARIDIVELRNWLREINVSSGAHLDKLMITPVDKQNDVKVQITLSWGRQA
jgi:general secretion pathway protein M